MKLSEIKFKRLLPVLIFCWPFVYLFHLIFPVNGQYTAIGNDFGFLYYKYKVYLLASLSQFHFPLWSPSESAGFPFYINPFTQAFYPLNLPLLLFYKMAGGYALLDHQVFTVLGVAIFALGLFFWLRLINSNIRAVVFSVMIISVSFKMTEILRFPNAVHTAAWYPWILYAITKIFISDSWKKSSLGGIVFVLSAICLCTGGYPYYIYYTQFLFVPYFLAFLIKPLRTQFFALESVNWKKVICVFAVAGILAGSFCLPHLLETKSLVSQATDRSGRDFAYSTSYEFTFSDTLGSLVFPPTAQSEGWYFFSIGGLILIVLYLLKGKTKLWGKLFFVIWIAIISYISYQKESYLFKFLWNYWPGFSSLRAWGRMNIILLPVFAWLLSYAYRFFEDLMDRPAKNKKNHVIAVLILIYAAIFVVQHYLYTSRLYDFYWMKYLKYFAGYENKFIITGAISFAFILFFLIKTMPKNLVVATMVLLCAIEMFYVGTHTWTSKLPVDKTRLCPDIAKIDMASFSAQRVFEYDTLKLDEKFNTGTIRNWYYQRYIDFLKN
ncbi:MAG: hypothetical protein PHP01_03120, partial [Phycisphaerae bacterium]|nr:hypothetical protein [Phycisphaerae bacterium]